MPGDDFEILASEPSPIGMICLRERVLPDARVVELTLDHQFLMSSHATDSERALAARAIAMHGGEALRVLVGGLGLGYTAREALRSERVAQVEVVELLAPVIGWFERGLIPLAAALRGDVRLAVREGDVYGLLAATPQATWDVILVDVDHAPGERLAEASASFYTEDGLRRARAHLAPAGVFGVWSYAESAAFVAALGRVFAEVRTETVEFENRVAGGVETNWLFLARG